MGNKTSNNSEGSADPAETASGPKTESSGFDAIAAAEEFAASLREPMPELEADPNAERYVDILESEIENLNQLVATKEAETRKADARAEQANAEIERSKERLARDSERELERRQRAVLSAFLEVLDDLDRALEATRAVDHHPDVVAGIELVRKRFLATLARFGVSHQPSLGEPFDPGLHDAVSTLPPPTPDDEGKVIAVVREGYRIGDEVLRAAGVVVGRRS